MDPTSNPLISQSKSSDPLQSVQLHPLVILTITDYLTRHVVRKHQDPLIGAILGTQSGRDVTMEHAFSCRVELDGNGDEQNWKLDDAWFLVRLEQYKEVHKGLDFVGWFTLTPPDGPQPHHFQIHSQMLDNYNESALLLAFHPSSVAESATKGGKLPLTIYETIWETPSADDGDKPMQGSAETPALTRRLRELPHGIETGDAEMISVDFVARGGASGPPKTSDKGKEKRVTRQTKQTNGDTEQVPTDYLTSEEREAIRALKSKANAIRMLQRRIQLLLKYVRSLPRSSYLIAGHGEVFDPHPQISHTILRSISALVARLPMIMPSQPVTVPSQEPETPREYERTVMSQESLEQDTDIALISLLGMLGDTLQSTQLMGKKAMSVEGTRYLGSHKRGIPWSNGGGGYQGGYGGGGDDGDRTTTSMMPGGVPDNIRGF